MTPIPPAPSSSAAAGPRRAVPLPVSCLALAAPVDLEPTVVSATTTERKLRDAPASVSLIDAEDLRRRPVRDLQEALRGSESLQFNGVGMSRRGISVRGMSSEHTLVLVDGQRISTSSGAIAHSDFDLGWVPVGEHRAHRGGTRTDVLALRFRKPSAGGERDHPARHRYLDGQRPARWRRARGRPRRAEPPARRSISPGRWCPASWASP